MNSSQGSNVSNSSIKCKIEDFSNVNRIPYKENIVK